MARIKKQDRYKTCVARYTSTSELLPTTLDASAGGLRARIKADKNYILPVFIVNSIMERYAHQHLEVRGEGMVDKRMRAYETKRVRPVVDFEVLPDYIDEDDKLRYERVMDFVAKLKDKKSEEYREFVIGENGVEDNSSLYSNLEVPISQFDYTDIKPKPPEHFEQANRYSQSRHPDAIEMGRKESEEVSQLKMVNKVLHDKIESQDQKIEKLMGLVEATIANQMGSKVEEELVEEDDAETTIKEQVVDV